jgi:predicted  nucleic acid-binding Zn-ribbon protein
MYVLQLSTCDTDPDAAQVIADRDAESRELRTQVEELEESHRDAHAKFEAALEHQEHQLELKEDEIEGANLEIQRLGQRVWELEDEGERLKDDSERVREEAAVDREALESVITALKEVRPNIFLRQHCPTQLHSLESSHRKRPIARNDIPI